MNPPTRLLFRPVASLSAPQLGLAAVAAGVAWLLPPWARVAQGGAIAIGAGFVASGLSLRLRVQALVEDLLHWWRQRSIKQRLAERERRIQLWLKQEPPLATEPSAAAPPRFEVDDAALLEHLEEHGYAVIKGVAGEAELAKARDLLWQFLESTPMERGVPATWGDRCFRAVGDPTTGIIAGNGFGHAEVCWYVRTLPRVKHAFARIWRTDQLITSFDGGNVFRPWHAKGSHRAHDDLMRYTTTSPDGQDFVTVPAPQINPAVRGGVLVEARAGGLARDLILWDSRTIHCNTPALSPPSGAEDELLRAVTYVCMTPRRFASQATLSLRRRAALAGVGSTHWPHDFKPLADPRCLEGIDEAALEEAVRDGRMSCDQHALI